MGLSGASNVTPVGIRSYWWGNTWIMDIERGQVIWKFPFVVDSVVRIEMPLDAKVLHVAMQGGTPCIWAAVFPAFNKVTRKFFIVGTGHPIPVHCQPVGTFQQEQFVWHLMEPTI